MSDVPLGVDLEAQDAGPEGRRVFEDARAALVEPHHLAEPLGVAASVGCLPLGREVGPVGEEHGAVLRLGDHAGDRVHARGADVLGDHHVVFGREVDPAKVVVWVVHESEAVEALVPVQLGRLDRLDVLGDSGHKVLLRSLPPHVTRYHYFTAGDIEARRSRKLRG